MSPRGVWGCSPQQLPSPQESLVSSSNSCAFYILLSLLPGLLSHTFPPRVTGVPEDDALCLSVYPGALCTPASPQCHPGGVNSAAGAGRWQEDAEGAWSHLLWGLGRESAGLVGDGLAGGKAP